MCLSIGECVSILTNYETWTGKLISHEQLHDGSLSDLLTEDDYVIHDKVPSLHYLTPTSTVLLLNIE